MAGSWKKTVFSTFYFIYTLSVGSEALVCLSNENKPVDWYIGYKLPNTAHNVQAYSLMYMDSDKPSWRLVKGTLDKPSNQAIYYTLSQIYNAKMNESGVGIGNSIAYAMYNDEKPTKMSLDRESSAEHGHTKGVLGFDEKTGFWLIQSTPRFPPAYKDGYSFPSTTNAQSFLCVSMETSKNLNEIGLQLQYNWPKIYDKNLPQFAAQYKEFGAALNGKHVDVAPWYRETKLVSLAGVLFLSFAKYSDWGKDLYADWLAPRFQDSLLVETWQNGIEKMCSNCTGTYQVMNIATLKFKAKGYEFKETQDHSKWAITNSSNLAWVCIGDINRQVPQMKRPGGTVCFQHKQVWTGFKNLVTGIHNCKVYNKCIPPDF